MIQVSKNYKLGNRISLNEITELAREGKAIAFRVGMFQKFNMKPAAFIQNWTIHTASKFEFYTIDEINP